jgi:hypothetical protein
MKLGELMVSIDRARLKSLMEREQQRFVQERPKSNALFERARKSLLGGVPMNWKPKAQSSSMWTATATSISASATPAP